MLAALVAFASCNSEKSGEGPQETGNFTFSLNFTKTPESKAGAVSTYIPATSWDNIQSLQIFLYNASGTVAFSKIIPHSDLPISGNYTRTFPNVPVGNYTVRVVANIHSSNVKTYTSSSAEAAFTEFNVLTKSIGDMWIKHASATKPTWLPSDYPAFDYYQPIAEIFSGSSTVNVTSTGTPSIAGAVSLERNVAMLRFRVDPTASPLNVGATGVIFDPSANGNNNGAVLLMRIPEKMTVQTGVTPNAPMANGLVVAAASGAWSNTEPNTALGSIFPGGANGRWYNQTIVLPTVGDVNANQYFVIISAWAPAGHELSNGDKMAAPGRVYWSGVINKPIEANKIYDIDLSLKSGGDDKPPIGPTEYGSLSITVNPPTPWNSIQTVDIELN